MNFVYRKESLKLEEETVSINKTNWMVMGKKPAVRPQRGRYPCGFVAKELEQTQYGVNVVKKHLFRNLRRAGDNFRCPTCVRGVVAAPQWLEVGEDSLEIVDSFHYLEDKISWGGVVESAVRYKISRAWCWCK